MKTTWIFLLFLQGVDALIPQGVAVAGPESKPVMEYAHGADVISI